MQTKMKTLIAALAIAGAATLPTAASAATVGLELLLLTDVSGSVDSNEYNLQRQGYITAFRSTAVQNAILGSQNGSIAVAYGEWSGASQQSMQVNWMVIDSVASANAFADALAATSRAFSGLTAPGSALNWGVGKFANEIDSLRQVIDAHPGDLRSQIVEISKAYIRFLMENPNFRSVIMLRDDSLDTEYARLRGEMTQRTREVIDLYCSAVEMDEKTRRRKTYVVRSLIYGAALLFDNCQLEYNEENMASVEYAINREFDLP